MTASSWTERIPALGPPSASGKMGPRGTLRFLRGQPVPRRCFQVGVVVLAVAGTGGCAGLPRECRSYSPTLVKGVIFSVDGAGNFGATSAALEEAAAEQRLSLAVEPVEWSHGSGRLLVDQMDYAHARTEGEKLAGQIRTRRQICPAGKVYLVGHSAGSAVVLAAAESLPPGSIDRIVLLAPAVAADYDVRPALRCCPIDVFYSSRDRGYLGLGVA